MSLRLTNQIATLTSEKQNLLNDNERLNQSMATLMKQHIAAPIQKPQYRPPVQLNAAPRSRPVVESSEEVRSEIGDDAIDDRQDLDESEHDVEELTKPKPPPENTTKAVRHATLN